MIKPSAFSSEAACPKQAQRKTPGDITDAGAEEDLTIRYEALCAHYGMTPTRAVDACYHRQADMMSALRLVCLRHDALFQQCSRKVPMRVPCCFMDSSLISKRIVA
jgi:hypothetical protein